MAITGAHLAYRSDVGFLGADSFGFKANDGTTDSNTVTVAITVVPNQPPVCRHEYFFDAEPGQDTSFDPGGFFNPEPCYDPDGEPLTFGVLSPPAHGTLRGFEPGVGFTYRPEAGYSGPDSFTFKAGDGAGFSDPSTVRITVLKPNHAPHCVTPLTLRVRPGGSLPLDSRLACSDPDGDALFPSLVSGPWHGELSIPGSVPIYTPDPGFVGADQIRFRVTDPRGATSNDATLDIVVGEAETTRPATPPTSDTTAPSVRAEPARRHRIATLRRRGLTLLLRSSEACRVTATISVDRRAARRLGLRSRTLGSATRRVPAGRAVIVVRLKPKARKALRHATRLRLRIALSATDAAGNRRTRVRHLTVSR